MRGFYLIWMLVLACDVTFQGRPVRFVGVYPPPPSGEPAPPTPSGPPPPTSESSPARYEGMEGPGLARDDPPPTMPVGPFQRRPMPSDEELYRLGMDCRAGKAAACREYALIYLPSRPRSDCHWGYLTDDPNGPVTQTSPVGRGRHNTLAPDKPACKPPEYRHMGPCGICILPRISCGYSEHGHSNYPGGSPFGHASSKCPAGDLCSVYGVCFPKESFPVEGHDLQRGETCYLSSECASKHCPLDGNSAFGGVGTCAERNPDNQ
jgi:hypothetical protein